MSRLNEAKDIVADYLSQGVRRGKEGIYVFTGKADGELVVLNQEGRCRWEYTYLPHKTDICYVGMGPKRRITQDLYRKISPPLENRHSLCSGISKEDAHTIERALIQHFGRIHNKTGCLVNETSGGKGVPDPPKELVEYRRKRLAQCISTYTVVDLYGNAYFTGTKSETLEWVGMDYIYGRRLRQKGTFIEGLNQHLFIKSSKDKDFKIDHYWIDNPFHLQMVIAWSVKGNMVIGPRLAVERLLRLSGLKIDSAKTGFWKHKRFTSEDECVKQILGLNTEGVRALMDRYFVIPNTAPIVFTGNYNSNLYKYYCIDEDKNILGGGNVADIQREFGVDTRMYNHKSASYSMPMVANSGINVWVCRADDYDSFVPCKKKQIILYSSMNDFIVGNAMELRKLTGRKDIAFTKLAKNQETFLGKWRCFYLHEAPVEIQQGIKMVN